MISKNEKAALERDGIHSGYKTFGEYRIYLEWENGYQQIRFRVEERSDGKFEFSQSHYIKTPEQEGPYRTSRTIEDTAEYALKRVVDTIMGDYELASKKGHKPSRKWFIENEDF